MERRQLFSSLVGLPQNKTLSPFGAAASVQSISALNVPVLDSRPAASKTLYLDFDGDPATTWGGDSVPETPAFSLDGDVSAFSSEETNAIRQIWMTVAEKYSPFDVNVTTVDPGTLAVNVSAKVIVGGTADWTGQNVSGTSFVNGFSTFYYPHSAYVFPASLQLNPKYVAETIAHEAGHLFGLRHQSSYDSAGSKTSEYNYGISGRAPIMGTSYYAERGLWWNGTTTSASTIQDDLDVLTNHLGVVNDDVGDSTSTASALTPSVSSVAASGLINTSIDADYFRFTTPAGTVSFAANVAPYGAMLDATLELRDASGNLVASAATASLSETLSANVAAGTYYVVVKSAGNYGDIGQYTLTGTLPSASTALSVDAGSGYTMAEGGSVNLAANLLSGTAASYAWDLDGDGVYGEIGASATRGNETGANVTLSAAGLDGPSTYVVGLRVTGTDGSTATDTANVSITNVGPALAAAAAPLGSINEGSPVTLSFVATDPGTDTISSWAINWGDGAALQTLAGNATSATKTYADNGTYTVTLTATDEDGSYSTTRTITVVNVAPTLSLTPPATLNEGSSGTFTFSATDPGADAITGWSINWGDGTSPTALAGSATSATKKYADNGTYTVTLTATDGDGSYSITRAITVLNVAPTLTLTPINAAVEGSTFGVSFAATDPGADTVSQWSVSWGDGTTTTRAGNFSGAAKVYPSSGTYTIILTAVDEDGSYFITRSVTVADVPPTITFNAPTSANEGSTVNVSFSATDPGNEPIGWAINWGDGQPDVYLADGASTASKQYIDNGVYTITLKASEPDGVFTTTRTITVNNVAPTITANTVATVPEGTSFPINFGATDPGYDTISKWVVNWGDGSAVQTLAGTATTATKTYANRGTYTITLTATDEDGSYSVTRSVVASAVAPTLSFTAPSSANEGSQIGVTFAAALAGGSPITGWTINWGDGSAVQSLAANATGATKTYADNGTYSILLTATDSAGSYPIARTVTVNNVAPTLTLTAPATVAEGASFSVGFGKTDPGADTVSQWVINWGDGSATTTKPGTATSATKTYVARGTYTITLVATDEDGSYSTTRSIIASAVAPTLTLNAPATANEGSPVNVTFAGVIAGTSAITGWSIDWGDGSAALSLAASATGASKTYADNGAYTITLVATDSAGSYPITKAIAVNNVAPTLTLTGPATADEGDALTFGLGVTDPGADALTGWSINWGDGSAVQTIGLGETSVTKTFADDGDYTVRLTATDEDGTYSTTRSIHVNNVPPTIVVTASAEWVAAGAAFSLSVAGPAAGVASWLVDWGDGHTDTFAASTRTFSYAYAENGSYAATVSAVDGEGNATPAGGADVDVLAAPTATISSIQTLTDATSQILVDVTYASPRGFEIAAFKRTDLTLAGFGSGVTVKMVSATSDDDGLTWSVRYSLNRGTAWSFGDDGTYSVGLKSGNVRDALGRSVGATPVSFDMQVRPEDTVGNDLASAKQLGEFTPGRVRTLTDAVGPWDKTDMYRFKVGTAGTVKIKLSDLSDNADLKVFNSSGTQIASSTRSGASTESLELKLPKGWIYVRVYDTKGEGTNYSLRLDLAGKAITPSKPTTNEPSPTLGPVQLGAFYAGRARSIGGTITGGADDGEYYRFRLNKHGAVKIDLSELSANADVELLNGLGQTIATSANDVDFDESISMTLDGGWYFVHVMPHAGQASDEGATGYSLRVAA